MAPVRFPLSTSRQQRLGFFRTVFAGLLESRKARSPDFHQHLNKPSKLGNAGRISGQVARSGGESGKTVFMKLFKHLKAGLAILALTWGLISLPLQAQATPGSGNNGAPSTPPSGNYPGTGSSPQPGVPPPPVAPSGPTPGSGNSGTPSTPPSGNYPGSGSSPQPGVPPPPLAPSGPTPGSGQSGTTNTPPSGVTPGTGTSPAPAH